MKNYETRDILRPVFIVGLPRSGTTVFYRTLARHPHFAWISPATRKLTRWYWPCRMQRLFRNHRLPVEAPRVWRKGRRAENDALLGRDVTPPLRRYYRKIVESQMRLADAPRFLSKHPRNGLRIPFFMEIFPEATFLHVIRDGRAVAESILRYRRRAGSEHRWWGMKPPGWEQMASLSPCEQIGWQWAECVRRIRADGRRLPSGRYHEVRYETFCEQPETTLHAVAESCRLDDPGSVWSHVTGLTSQNSKWREALSARQIAETEKQAGPVLAELGYAPSSCLP